MLSNYLSATASELQIPFRFFSDEASLVQHCCEALQLQSGIRINAKNACTLDDMLHLDSNASNALRYATKYREPVCFRASVRVREESLLPVYWTVVPEAEGYNWYGFPAREKDRTEGRLKELELIVSSFHDVVFELNADGNFLNFWVRDPSKLFVPPAAFLGRYVIDVLKEYFTPLDVILIPAYEESMSTGSSKTVEYQLPGIPAWFSCRFTPVKNPESQIVGMLVIITDISAQKNLEINLRQSEERHRDLFENANDIIYIIDTNARVLSMNRMAEELLGFTEAEMIGNTSHRFFAPEKLAVAIEHGNEKREGLVKVSLYESEFISKSGNRIPVEISSRIIYKNGQPTGIHVTARDISLQKKSQQELAKSEARFRFLSEYSRDMVCLHRPNGNYIYVSSAARHLLGYDPEELIDKSPYDYFHPEDAKSILRFAHLQNAAGFNTPSIQYRYRRKDGAYIWLESVSQPILEEGEVIYIQTNSRDITDRKSDEQKLIEREGLSSALANASRILLEQNTLIEGLESCFPILGAAVHAECLFVIKNNTTDPFLYHIWCASGPCSVKQKSHLFLRSSVLLSGFNSLKPAQVFEFQRETETNNSVRQQ